MKKEICERSESGGSLGSRKGGGAWRHACDAEVMLPFHDTGFWCQLLEGSVEGSPGKVFVSPLSRISESFRRDIGQILTWKMFFIIKNIFIMKNLTARKTVEAGVDPHLCSAYLEDNWIKP